VCAAPAFEQQRLASASCLQLENSTGEVKEVCQANNDIISAKKYPSAQDFALHSNLFQFAARNVSLVLL